jgi:hypothetical protein
MHDQIEAIPGEFFYKLDNDKVLSWLKSKVHITLERDADSSTVV